MKTAGCRRSQSDAIEHYRATSRSWGSIRQRRATRERSSLIRLGISSPAVYSDLCTYRAGKRRRDTENYTFDRRDRLRLGLLEQVVRDAPCVTSLVRKQLGAGQVEDLPSVVPGGRVLLSIRLDKMRPDLLLILDHEGEPVLGSKVSFSIS